MLKFRPFQLIFSILFFMELVMAMLLKVFETRIGSNSDITLWSEAFWTVTQVSLNCGYGNVYPVTYEGKVICVLTGIIGLLIFSLVIASIGE